MFEKGEQRKAQNAIFIGSGTKSIYPGVCHDGRVKCITPK